MNSLRGFRALVKRRGTVIVIILGLVSVMIFFVFGISNRKTSQTQLLSMSDLTQISRFYLESYIGDVLWKLRKNVNSKDTAIQNDTASAYNLLRTGTAGTAGTAIEGYYSKKITLPPTSFQYSPSGGINQLEDDLSHLKITRHPPEVEIFFKDLDYPAMMNVPAKNERKGLLQVKCSATFDKVRYKIVQRFPFRTVLPVTPLLKEFVFFADQISAEQDQTNPWGETDKLNVLKTKDSGYEKALGKCENPWVFLFSKQAGVAKANGKIFLGRDAKNPGLADDKVILNLAGENRCRTRETPPDVDKWCDLWLVKPRLFDTNLGFERAFDWQSKAFRGPNDTTREFRAIQMDFQGGDAHALLHLRGFSQELVDIETQTTDSDARIMKDFLGNDKCPPDPVYQHYSGANLKYAAYSTSLKIHGHPINLWDDESRYQANDDGTYPPGTLPENTWAAVYPYPRVVFGKVFGRFFLLNLAGVQSSDWFEIPYDTNMTKDLGSIGKFNKGDVDLDDGTIVKFTYPPGKNYGDYMSRVVSGGGKNAPTANYFSINQMLPTFPPGAKAIGPNDLDRHLNFKHFLASDGVTLNGPFIDFAKDWVVKLTATIKQEEFDRSIYSRVCRYFKTQDDFKKEYKLSNTSTDFLLNNIVFIDGDLDLRDGIDTKPDAVGKSDHFRGGMIITKGKITIGDIDRGHKNFTDLKKVQEEVELLTPDNILTLVSMQPTFSGNYNNCIEFTGKHYLGIQAIVLAPTSITLAPKDIQPMITFSSTQADDRIFFFGGLAVSTPGMQKQITTAGKNPAFFGYVPCMADDKWTTIVTVSSDVRNYSFNVGE